MILQITVEKNYSDHPSAIAGFEYLKSLIFLTGSGCQLSSNRVRTSQVH